MQDKIRLYRLNAQQRRNALKIIGGVLEKKREIVFAFVHGSFCDEPAFRDIDLGIFLQGVRKEEYSDIALKLSSEIEEGLAGGIPLDTRVINEAPLPFRFRVLRGLLIFSRDDEFLFDYMARTARTYLDFSPLRNRYLAEAII